MKSSFPLNASGSKLSTSWMIYFQLMLCMWTGGVAGWSYFYSNTTMDWRSARQWCRNHYTDMVAIQNQQEIEHLNSWLPRQPTYYWIGIRKVDDVWTWVGTNKSLTDQATNWATGEPNNKGQVNGINEDCVEMYIKRESQAGKWNDEKCVKSKTALCYAAACKNDSCDHGECVETINSHKCQCNEGFYGDKCEHVVQCDSDEVVAPAKANVSCSHTHGAYAYGTLCNFSCEEGHGLSHPDPMRCTAAGSWSMAPTCEPVQCPVLPETDNMAVRCEGDTGGRFSYGSSCTFTCSRGYSLRGAYTTTCTATAAWSEAVSSCERVTCPMPQGDGRTTAHCSGPLDALQPGSTCSFTCEPGFEVLWAPVIACTEEGSWNASVPTCRAVQCSPPVAPESGQINCQPLLSVTASPSSYPQGSACTFTCNEGYEHQGPLTTECTQSGQWSSPPPTCTVVHCEELSRPGHGTFECQHPLGDWSFVSFCVFSCEEGYDMPQSRSDTLLCGASGHWNDSVPICAAVQCPVLPETDNMAIRCEGDTGGRFSYGSSCTFTCSRGYSLRGAHTTTCTATAAWSDAVPSCERVTCPMPQGDGRTTAHCSGPLDALQPGSTCSFTCEPGFEVQWTPVIACTEEGSWNASMPTCRAVQCSPPVAPESGQINCQPPLSVTASPSSYPQGSACTFTCNEGYEHQGPLTTECTQSGQWSSPPPTCTVVHCEELSRPGHGTLECQHPLGDWSFVSFCVFSCEEGYDMPQSRSDTLLCGTSGHWNDSVPICAAVQCPVLPETDNMAIRCEGDTGGRFSYGSSCTFTCSRGYSLRGAHTTTCTATAAWSDAVPSCERVTCPMPQGDGRTTAHCSGPLDALQPGSTCSFTCEPGFEVQWAPVIACTEEGSWNASMPTCRVVTCDQGPAPEAHSIVRCSDTHGSVEYGAVCEYVCEEGYHISDPSQNAVLCTAAGTWSRPPAVCERSAVQCSPPVAPESGQINCQPPLSVTASPSSYPQGSACTFTCNEGYEHQGPLTTECTQSGQWSSPLPTCTAMGCPVLNAPVDGALNCTDSDQTHASQCSFACNQGFTLRGHRVVTCGLHGNWTAETPVCQAVPRPSHTEMVLAAGGAVSLSALSLAVWLMKRLRKVKERKFSLASNSDAEDPPQHYKNSIDGLI